MLLETIRKDPIKSFLHMERYVNIGSPSGFTDKYTTSLPTSPKGPNESFSLCSIEFPNEFTFEDFGVTPDFFKEKEMFVHPDMIDDDLFSNCTQNREALLVVPTSSARTVKVIGENGWFLKLNYKGLIGRFERQIARKQASSAVEVTNIIQSAINNGKLPKSYYIFPEVGARVVDFPDKGSQYEWGIVFREPLPFPHNEELKYIIPGFSLFSRDEMKPDDPTVLTQLIINQRKSVEDFLFEDLISPIFESYFCLLLQCGLQLEAHAQNISFVLNEDMDIIGLVARDAESIDKDISLIEDMKIGVNVKTTEWKCILREQYNYHIMHSFMFDFKLGKYLISPIIEEALKSFSFDKGKLIDRIKSFNNYYIRQLPHDFFPLDGKWYSYDNIVHDRTKKRPYVASDNPDYR